jgi:hypothetical protein
MIETKRRNNVKRSKTEYVFDKERLVIGAAILVQPCGDTRIVALSEKSGLINCMKGASP